MAGTIVIDFANRQGALSPRLYGAGFEHVGSSVYGGFWIGPQREADLPARPSVHIGWREDVLALVKALRPGVLRWPGGNFAQTYHWRDGIGPRDDRPLRFDHFWSKPEPNQVGTDEFLDLCRQIGAEPAITINSRTARPEDAAAWVEYCNGSPDTTWGAVRTRNGQAEPQAVKLWAVGSQGWEMEPAEAARRHRAYANAMRRVDPSIEIIAVGGNTANHHVWDSAMIEHAGGSFAHLGEWAYDGIAQVDSEMGSDLYYANCAAAERILWPVSNAVYQSRSQPWERRYTVGLDSWGIWRHSRQGLQHDNHLCDALVAATVLHGLHRLAPDVSYAAWGNLVNALGLIQATERRVWTTPVYQVMKLFRDLHGNETVRCTVAGPAIDTPPGSSTVRAPAAGYQSMSVLDATATRDLARGRYTLSVVNRSYDERIDTDIEIAGLPQGIGATSYLIRTDGPFDTNTAADPQRIEPFVFPIGTIPLNYPFPPRSLVVLIWEETPGLT